MTSGETGRKLTDLIEKALSDLEVTTTEYSQIMALAAADGVEDAQEKALLSQLQGMIANNTVRRVPG